MATSMTQTHWKVGLIPARKCMSKDGRESYIANVNAPVMISDAVIKFFPLTKDGRPAFMIEAHDMREESERECKPDSTNKLNNPVLKDDYKGSENF